jgi:hypothetical protein
MVRKTRSLFFYPKTHFELLFLHKTPRKQHSKDLVKPIHSKKNIKSRPKTQNPPETKTKLSELKYDF